MKKTRDTSPLYDISVRILYLVCSTSEVKFSAPHMKYSLMGWLMSYVFVLAAAVIPTITAGMPGIKNSLLGNKKWRVLLFRVSHIQSVDPPCRQSNYFLVCVISYQGHPKRTFKQNT